MAADTEYFKNNFNTPLNPQEEAGYQAWAAKQGHPDDTADYDMRGAYKEMQGADNADARGHFPDTYKKPNHPTFSDQSKYHGTPDEINGGTWEGGKWGTAPDGRDTYTPSKKMRATTMPDWALKRYMQEAEPEAKLILE